MAAMATIVNCIPSCWYLWRTPNHKQFLLAMFNVSMAFYLFSFHVHEKQIILPLLFFAILIVEFRHFFSMMATVSNVSLCLLYKNEVNIPCYIALTFGYQYFAKKVEACMINSFRIG